eukprot:scaffold431_cov315-Prasinococcus_capsulatus_cf.AAC.2
MLRRRAAAAATAAAAASGSRRTAVTDADAGPATPSSVRKGTRTRIGSSSRSRRRSVVIVLVALGTALACGGFAAWELRDFFRYAVASCPDPRAPPPRAGGAARAVQDAVGGETASPADSEAVTEWTRDCAEKTTR